jgi:transcriptional regulator with XRE-family HTH domain
MDTQEKTAKNTHHGHAIKRYRHTLGIKQEALAADMGISQALVSFYEQKKEIEDDMIDKFAGALNIAPELIKELEEDPVTIIIENNTIEKGGIIAQIAENNTTHNNPDPTDRIIELANEKTALYERMLELERNMLKLEKEKNALLEKLLKERK